MLTVYLYNAMLHTFATCFSMCLPVHFPAFILSLYQSGDCFISKDIESCCSSAMSVFCSVNNGLQIWMPKVRTTHAVVVEFYCRVYKVILWLFTVIPVWFSILGDEFVTKRFNLRQNHRKRDGGSSNKTGISTFRLTFERGEGYAKRNEYWLKI